MQLVGAYGSAHVRAALAGEDRLRYVKCSCERFGWSIFLLCVHRTVDDHAGIALELACYAFDFAKFRREASYHMWSAKAWGVALFLAFFALLAMGSTGQTFAVPIYLGIIVDIEGIAISLALPEWKPDVPSIFHALKLR